MAPIAMMRAIIARVFALVAILAASSVTASFLQVWAGPSILLTNTLKVFFNKFQLLIVPRRDPRLDLARSEAVEQGEELGTIHKRMMVLETVSGIPPDGSVAYLVED